MSFRRGAATISDALHRAAPISSQWRGSDTAIELHRFHYRSIRGAAVDRSYEIRFQSLFNKGRALCFPCDERGNVEMDALSDRARENYLFARAVVGSEFAYPTVLRAGNAASPG
jgi:hypothetical protein